MKPTVLVLSALLAAGLVGCESAETEHVVAEASDRTPTAAAEDSGAPQAGRESGADTLALEPARQATPPAPDRSYLTINIADARLLVTDSTGRRTGIDPATGEEFLEIPRAVHYADAIDDDVTGEAAVVTVFSVEIPRPSEGTYRVLVGGLKQGARRLQVGAVTVEGDVQRPLLKAPVILEVGSTSLFEVEYFSSPGATSRLTRLATFESTLEDISNCFEQGLIPDEATANELTQRI